MKQPFTLKRIRIELHEIVGGARTELTNGNITMRGMHGSLHAELVNGNVLAEMILPVNGVCEIGAVNGVIGLHIPKTTSAEFDAEVSNGAISLTGLALQATVTSPKSVHGRLGSGEGRIALQTVNGNIEVAGF